MKFVYYISLLSLLLSSLTACDKLSSLIDSQADRPVEYKMLEFSREGGQCLGDPDVTKENERCAKVEVRYPEIEATPVEDMGEQLNAKIQDILLSNLDDETRPEDIEQMAYLFIQDFKKELPHGATDWSLTKEITVLFNTPEMMSFQIDESGYTGGAHGYYRRLYMNIDLDIMQEIKLSDLLLPGYEAELNVTAEKIFRKIRDIPHDADLFKAGFEFQDNKFALNDSNDHFAVTDKGLVFYFNQYEIASYADGPTEILVPYNKIQNLIDPTGLIAGFLTSEK